MNSFLVFLQALMPTLLEYGSELFHFYQGDVSKARSNIAFRKDEIAARRLARDRDLEEKYIGPERRRKP